MIFQRDAFLHENAVDYHLWHSESLHSICIMISVFSTPIKRVPYSLYLKDQSKRFDGFGSLQNLNQIRYPGR